MVNSWKLEEQHDRCVVSPWGRYVCARTVIAVEVSNQMDVIALVPINSNLFHMYITFGVYVFEVWINRIGC